MNRYSVLEVARHLCGFEEPVARRRLLLMLKVFADESGDGDSPVFVMAGFLARAEAWAEFNIEWREVLDRHPRLDAFHMTDARWSGHDTKLPALVDVIRKHVLTGAAIMLPLQTYNKEQGQNREGNG